MASFELALTIGGIAYGILLVAAFFINNKFLGTFRLEAMFMRNPSPSIRGINLVVGLAIIGYNVYTLMR